MTFALSIIPLAVFFLIVKLTDSFTLVKWRHTAWSFLGGILICFLALKLATKISDSGLAFFAPLIEELFKFLVLIILVRYRRIIFIEQALCYGAAVGAGFAFTENLVYLSLFEDMQAGTALFRGLGTASMHMLCPMTAGTLLAYAASTYDTEKEKARESGKLAINLLRAKCLSLTILGFSLAVGMHTLFNLQIMPLWIQLAMTMLVFTVMAVVISNFNEKRICKWLDYSINNDIQLLGAIKEGRMAGTKQGEYLITVCSQFDPELMVDMMCYIRIYLEIIIAEKSRILMKEAGYDTNMTEEEEQEQKNAIKEFHALRRRIGKTGERVLRPIVNISSYDSDFLNPQKSNKKAWWNILPLFLLFFLSATPSKAQKIYEYRQLDTLSGNELILTFFSPRLSQYIPHIVRRYNYAVDLHRQNWGINDGSIMAPVVMLSDWEDDGNAGAAPLPYNLITIGMAPMNMSYFTSQQVERYSHLFRHEYTHIVMTDHAAASDLRWRNFFGGAKVSADNRYPLSMLWSYMSVPRWYAPRWYQEGIACFMETWTGGGVGRALGGYDEMYFRTLIHDGETLSSVVGLESEGTTQDFQLGSNAYLYGTRFTNYLALKYGYDKLRDFYYRTDDSRALYSNQFRKIYKRRLRDVWDEWRDYEKLHQERNMEILREYPLTETEPILKLKKRESMRSSDDAFAYGSASPMVFDDSLNVAYAAVNYPGDFAHIERIDLATGARKKLSGIDGPMLYQTTYLTLDKRHQRLIWSTRNSSWRGFCVMDLESGRKKDYKYQRLNNIVYNNVDDCMYGLVSNEGRTFLVRYDSNFENRQILYTFPFGVSISDLDLSHNGKTLVMSKYENDGACSLITFSVKDLSDAIYEYKTICTLPDANLSQFRFSADDSRLLGTSYYTGVANLWEIECREGAEMKLLSNIETGLFAPYMAADSTIYAYRFVRQGMQPVKLKYKVLEDCNAVSLLGQEAYEANSKELESLSVLKTPARHIEFGAVYDSIRVYEPLKHMKFTGAYPDISGFTDKSAWNKVTPVLGYHASFSDPLGISRINLSVGMSPWSRNEWKNRVHLMAEWKFWEWTFNASWNPTNFYDLVGPLRKSRKGYRIGAAYDKVHTTLRPFSWGWGANLNAFGDMDVLPLFQEIEIDKGISSFQTAGAYIVASKLKSSLGGVTAEQGWSARADASAYLAGGKLFPAISGNFDAGVLLPFMRNTSFWLRSAVGQNFGAANSAFGNDYFGGFRNNYVDYGDINRYRSVSALPGASIDAVKAHSFAKFTAELNLMPIRFKNTGALTAYPTYAQLSLFSSDLIANPWGKEPFHNHINVGAQLNVEIVFFNYFKTTWSLGYARVFNQHAPDMPGNSGQWLFSLKLL